MSNREVPGADGEATHFALTDEDETIINRGPVPWWKIEAGDHADYAVMLDCETNGQGVPSQRNHYV